jgi:hypothetical protein
MNGILNLSAAFAAVALVGVAHAAAPVALLTPVSFDPSTERRMQVRTECKLDEMLATHIGDALRRSNKGTGTTTSAEGDVLKVTVTTIWGARGNNWTGPKGLVLHADLMRDGQVQRSIDLHRTTMGGFWGAFKGICGFMDRDAIALGKDLARWSDDPSFKPEDSPEPPSAPEPASDAAK